MGRERESVAFAKQLITTSDALDELYRFANERKNLTLLFAWKDERHNNAVVLKDLLQGMRKPPTGTGRGARARCIWSRCI